MNLKHTLTLVFAFTNILSAAVTINEFHYDNAGSDIHEFVEIVITDPAMMSPDDIDVFFYNGGDGTPYKEYNLASDFDAHGILSDTHAYYSKLVPGMQNGAPDGIAVTYNGTVSEFISYEGSFEATEGPAFGMISTDILAYETTATLTDSSLQRVCFGTTWTLTEGFNTMGEINTGCTSTVPVPGACLLTCLGLGVLPVARKRLR